MLCETSQIAYTVGMQLSPALSIKHPIVQAPMAGGVTTAALVAAVCNAGGLGSLAAGYLSPDVLQATIKRVKKMTPFPFAVNLFIPEKFPNPTVTQIEQACRSVEHCASELALVIERPLPPYSEFYHDQIAVLLDEKIPIVSFTFGHMSANTIKHFKENGTVLMGTATTVAKAVLLEDSGVDIIIAQGSEAGGHRGGFLKSAEHSLMPGKELQKQLSKKIKAPIIVAGGIMDGKKMRSCLKSGAHGVQLGTAFLTCKESGAHPLYKDALLNNKNNTKTVLTKAFSGKLARGLNHLFIECMQAQSSTVLPYPVQHAITQPMRLLAARKNNINFMAMWAGEYYYLSRDLTAAALIDELLLEAAEF